MILIDSIFINMGGGSILLDYLVEELENSNMAVYYLFDKRCEQKFKHLPNDRRLFLNSSLIERHLFYLKNKNKFNKIFCFGNLPPTIKLKIPVFTYLHQRFYIRIPNDLPFKAKVKFKLKRYIFQVLISNSSSFIVQTQSMKDDFLLNIKSKIELDVKVLPFYKPLNYNIDRVRNSFIYVSLGGPHKNHNLLLAAFKAFYDKFKLGQLYLTLIDNNDGILEKIDDFISQGYPIINLGYVNREKLQEIYGKCEYCIYPSLTESFGLGIIEAAEGGCKIIGSDLEYMNSICIPTLKFDPYSYNDLVNVLSLTQTQETLPTQLLVNNEIKTILNLLS